MLRVIAAITPDVKKNVRKNIITLIAFYQWNKTIYFVFPFVEEELNRVLRDGWIPPDRVNKSQRSIARLLAMEGNSGRLHCPEHDPHRFDRPTTPK